MARRRAPQEPNRLGPSAVIGLEGGREVARRRQRRRQLKDKVIGTVGAIVAIAVVAAAAFIGYTMYVEQQASDQLEIERRQAELYGGSEDVHDAIEDLEESPRWNGPGNPTFGVGERIEVIAPATVPADNSGG